MSEIITASAVRFNALPTAHDGYTLLYEDNRVCQSDVKLSELVGDMSAYLTEEKANTLYQGKGDYLSASTSANFYPMTGNPSGFLTSEKDWTDTIKAASANAVNTTSAWVKTEYYDIDEINYFLDEKYDKSETSSKNELNLAFGTKQDKGDYYFASNPSGFITGVDLSNYYTKQETSGTAELSTEFSKYMEIPAGLSVNKQYGYTTTGWSEIAAGGADYSAGTDLVIKNNIIGVNTYNCNVNSSNYAFVEGYQNSAMGQYSHAEGQLTSAGGRAAHAEGIVTYAKQDGAHAEGWATSAIHQCSHAEGSATKADWCAHAEGHACTAFAEASHAEGYQTSAQARYAHSEGYQTSAYGEASHAEGTQTTAQGNGTHAEGSYTIAGSDNMHVGGKYNKTSADALYVIGNGTADDARSDAFIVYPDGSVSAAGNISANGVELGLQAVNKQVTIPAGSTVASVTLDNDKYNIIETITSAATELDINIPKSLTKVQEGAFEFSVEPNSVLVTVNAYMAGRQLPIKAPSAFDSTKLYQGTSLNNVLVIAEFDTYPITINNISTNDTSSSIVITVDGTMGSEPLPNNLEYTLALSIDGTVTNIDATGTTVTLTGTQYTNYSNADLVTADVIIDNKNYGTFTLKEVDPYNPLNLPANTIRVRYNNGKSPSSTNPNITIIRNYPYNEYDITYNNDNWQGLFSDNSMIATATKSNITDVLGANTTNVTAFGGDDEQGKKGCFEGCESLSSVQIFDTSNAVDFGRMFTNCSKLNNVPLFDTSNVSSTKYMFYQCTAMSSAPEFDTSKVENWRGMFEGTKLTAIPEYDLSNAKNISYICTRCYSLKEVPLFKNTNNIVSSYQAFNSCNAVSGGISALYTQLAACQSLVNGNHNGTFRNCGTDTTQGATELANIPSDWK